MFRFETISAKMLDYYIGRSDAQIIDLRSPKAYEKSHIRSAVSIPYEELEESSERLLQIPKNLTLIFYCDRGNASLKTARKAAGLGWKSRSVIGGFAAYRGRNLVFFDQS